MTDFPCMIAQPNSAQPVPRRVRGILSGRTVLDTTSALYVWEWPNYPQFYIPLADVDPGLLVDEQTTESTERGIARIFGIREGRAAAARLYSGEPLPVLADTVRFEWDALDSWFEEDEQVFVHPRNPYTRVDALRSSREVRVELDGVLLAASSSLVLVFETGLPTRYYFERTAVRFEHLVESQTVSSCPYKGRTSGCWSIRVGDIVHPDLAWTYDFPTRELLPIAGMVAFYNELVDVSVDGRRLDRPRTHFVDSD